MSGLRTGPAAATPAAGDTATATGTATGIDRVRVAPGSLPLLGHALPLWRDPLGFLKRLPASGEVVRVNLGTMPVYFVTNHRVTHELLVERARFFDKGRFFERARVLVGDGLVTAGAEVHRRHRRLMQPMFHHRRIATYADTMARHMRRVAAGWRPGEVIAADQEFYRYTIETLTDSLFSTAITPEQADRVRTDVPVLIKYALVRAVAPRALDRLPIRANREFDAASARLRGIIDDIVARARDTGGDDGPDLLSTLLAARDADTGESLTDVEVRDELVTILFAGTETSATTLSWLFHEVARHPEVEARLLAEIDEVVGGADVNVGHISRLEYLGRVVDEVTRLHAVPLLMRRALEDVELGGVRIPAGTEIGFSLYALHQDPRAYPEPERFDPERWTPEARAARPREEFVPFGAGKRVCIGDAYARMEIMVAAATVLSRLRLRPAPGHRVREMAAAVAHPDRLPMIVEERRPGRG